MDSDKSKPKYAYKLMRERKDGSFGSLFINCKQRLYPGLWYAAEDKRTKGFAHRPGWHCVPKKSSAPHLSKRSRVWVKIEIVNVKKHRKPKNQGGLWYTAGLMKIIKKLETPI